MQHKEVPLEEMDPAAFYDEMAGYYHLLLPGGFDAGTKAHADTLHQIIQEKWSEQAHTILDVCCGIGTQSIGLAAKGYMVTASDVSAKAIERAKQAAAGRGLKIDFSVADMRQAFDHHERQFDVVLAVDNGLTNLLSDGDILEALGQIHACCRPGGGFVASVHDYENEDLTRRQVRPYGIREENSTRYFIFQVWDFDGPIFVLSLYIVKESADGSCETRVMRTKSYAIGTSRLMALFKEAGFQQVEKIEYRFVQPIIMGVKGR